MFQTRACDLRRALLPDLNQCLPDYQVAFSYRPVCAEVGGDFYNGFALDRGRFALVLGDVGGKGLGAAEVACWVQAALRPLVVKPGATPAGVLSDAHQAFVAQSFERIATLFVGFLELSSGQMAYCSAGHEPALLCGNSGVIRLLTGQPAFTGLPGEPYQDCSIQLGWQDTLFVYTDGLTEAGITHPEQGALGLERIERLLAKHAASGPEVLLSTMCRVAGAHGHPLHDDILMLALRRNSSPSESTPMLCRRCSLLAPCCSAPTGEAQVSV